MRRAPLLLGTAALPLLAVACFRAPALPEPPTPTFGCPLEAPAAVDPGPLPAPGLSDAPRTWTSDLCGYTSHGLHRLTRTEYAATLQTLLGVEVPAARDFPQDDIGAGFDNMATLLGVPALWMEQHEVVVRKAVAAALRKNVVEPRVQLFEAERYRSPGGRVDAGNFFLLNGEDGLPVLVDFPAAGTYTLRVRAFREPVDGPPVAMTVEIDGAGVATFDVEGTPAAPQVYEVTLDRPWSLSHVTVRLLEPKRGRRLYLDFLEVDGPYGAPVGADPAPRAALLTCTPEELGAEACALQIWSDFARRAWRAPVTAADVEPFLGLLAVVAGDPPDGATPEVLFEEGVRLGLEAILLSPRFVFRVEADDGFTSPRPLTDHELAQRLSYFLWSAPPDERLRTIAELGSLQDDDVLEAEVRRMLRDPRSRALLDNFVAQWLGLRAMDQVWRSEEVYPEFDGELRVNMRCETEKVVHEVLHSGGTVDDLLSADFTWVTERLAAHYGIEGVTGDGWHRVELDDDARRRGVLTHGSVLTLTSHPERTSPVRRGKWVLDNLLCSPPPPPPPGVEGLPEEGDDAQGSLRERMERHRSDPVCASCHDVMDPIGFGLENYDATGAWRDTDGQWDIESSGLFLGYAPFDSGTELASLIADEPDYRRCAAEKAMTYAFGRELDERDACLMDDVLQRWSDEDDGVLADLFVRIALSPTFRMREGGTP